MYLTFQVDSPPNKEGRRNLGNRHLTLISTYSVILSILTQSKFKDITLSVSTVTVLLMILQGVPLGVLK